MNVGFYTIPNRPKTHVDIGQKPAKKVLKNRHFLIGKGVKIASSHLATRQGTIFPLFVQRDIRRTAVKYLLER